MQCNEMRTRSAKLQGVQLCFALACLLLPETGSTRLDSFVQHSPEKRASNDGPAIRKMQLEAEAAAKLEIPKVTQAGKPDLNMDLRACRKRDGMKLFDHLNPPCLLLNSIESGSAPQTLSASHNSETLTYEQTDVYVTHHPTEAPMHRIAT